jgi:hypothetical protein
MLAAWVRLIAAWKEAKHRNREGTYLHFRIGHRQIARTPIDEADSINQLGDLLDCIEQMLPTLKSVPAGEMCV